MENDLNAYLDRKEACTLLHCSMTTLWTMTKNGKLKGYKFGKKVLYKRSEIDNALEHMEPVEV